MIIKMKSFLGRKLELLICFAPVCEPNVLGIYLIAAIETKFIHFKVTNQHILALLIDYPVLHHVTTAFHIIYN